MKFSCEKALLQAAIAVSARAAASKSSIPALEGILLEADSELRLTGYNLETGIRTVVPAQVSEGGSLVLSSRLFGEIVRRLPDDMVTFSSEDLTVHIQCGMSEFNIQGIDPEEFPELPAVERQNALELPQSTLADMIGRTLFAVSDNESRPILTGSLFEVIGDTLAVVSVDGQRLAIRREKLENKPGMDFSFVVPGAALNEVKGICSDTEETALVTTGARHVLFKVGSTLLVTRRLEGEFLDYRQAISRKSTVLLTADVRQLMASIDRVSLIISEKFKSPLRCTMEDGSIFLTTRTAIGDASDRCPVEGSGGDLKIGFNNRLLMDALKAVPTDRALLKLGTSSSPCVIVPVDAEEGAEPYLFMVLPVRLSAG
ncbi:DNA polymerase III subunit beta [Candidatus Pseudoscillospira sp. SGI.172]|uniref:DNA polymerase III subunit beta n=1 Tax=Candidatus Pseudoscillospira sp. SGI.172 TaxID=3420582 RepID=UPI0009B9397B|nr:DNA polymerase III subunit beta [Pseudoflavonifractor sp.]MDY3019918.1 DNA polymerase III subunit beta [Oscillospiraceae bacterium]